MAGQPVIALERSADRRRVSSGKSHPGRNQTFVGRSACAHQCLDGTFEFNRRRALTVVSLASIASLNKKGRSNPERPFYSRARRLLLVAVGGGTGRWRSCLGLYVGPVVLDEPLLRAVTPA